MLVKNVKTSLALYSQVSPFYFSPWNFYFATFCKLSVWPTVFYTSIPLAEQLLTQPRRQCDTVIPHFWHCLYILSQVIFVCETESIRQPDSQWASSPSRWSLFTQGKALGMINKWETNFFLAKKSARVLSSWCIKLALPQEVTLISNSVVFWGGVTSESQSSCGSMWELLVQVSWH